MYSQSRYEPVDFLGDPPPRDFLLLMAALFVTFSLSFFTDLPRFLLLSSDVWQRGFLWQLATYIFTAPQSSPLWFMVTLLILFMFGKQVRGTLGKRNFWKLLLQTGITSAVVAVGIQIVLSLLEWENRSLPFVLMQGDRIVLTILIAAYATLFRHAVIRLFFVLPIRARDFLWLEILFAFMAFLPTKDLAGFVGVTTAVAMTYAMLTGGIPRMLREWRLRAERLILELRMRTMRKRRGIRLVKPDEGGDARRGPWVN